MTVFKNMDIAPKYSIGQTTTNNGEKVFIVDRVCNSEAWIFRIKNVKGIESNLIYFHEDALT